MSLLTLGSVAPDFTVKDQEGNTVSLASQKGKKVVLYFYPKDDTPGCTKEACSFRDNFPQFQKLGVTVFGVSVDDEKKHKKFIEKYQLPFTLLADTDKKIVESYKVWGKKKFMGKEYMGINRVTYIIDETGKISHVFDKVKPEGHAEQILAAIQ
ncbi:MAG: thioredoxin-dependent thiol peroxidase [Chloroherpetonaceae bacterium]|nr:thioredoxin-dependent thiol peroxidase [Chloroherpetonaceae bacterium]